MLQPINAARSHSRNRRAGFTLMELLVVIAIIAVLIGFLLPALSQARRNSNTIKCLSALKDLFNSYQAYAVEFKQAWPVVQHCAIDSSPGGGSDPFLLPAGNERHWCDLLAKYAGGQKYPMTDPANANPNAPENYLGIQRLKNAKSLIWGCPEWQSSNMFDLNPGGTANTFQVGYGMNPIAKSYDYTAAVNPGVNPKPPTAVRYDAGAWISIRGDAKIHGSYHKSSTWGKKGSDRLLLADSQVYYVNAAVALVFPTNVVFQGYSGSPVPSAQMQWPPDPTSPNHLIIDGGRHLKPGVARDKMIGLRGTNVLFCDGHAGTLSVREAWQAILWPGTQQQ